MKFVFEKLIDNLFMSDQTFIFFHGEGNEASAFGGYLSFSCFKSELLRFSRSWQEDKNPGQE